MRILPLTDVIKQIYDALNELLNRYAEEEAARLTHLRVTLLQNF